MKTLKLLNRKYLLIIFINFFLCVDINSEEQPIDIWNVDKEEIEQESLNDSIVVNDDNQIDILDIIILVNIILDNQDLIEQGDLNQDNVVDVLDVIQAVNYILIGQYIPIADLNDDGSVNVSDIIMIVNIILTP